MFQNSRGLFEHAYTLQKGRWHLLWAECIFFQWTDAFSRILEWVRRGWIQNIDADLKTLSVEWDGS